MIIHSRAEWNARPPNGRFPTALNLGIIVHWNGPGMGAYSQSSVPGIVRSTQNFHMDTRGWADIAYNFACDRFGEIWEGRGLDVANAASGDTWANFNLIALELMLGEGDLFPPPVKNALVEFGRWVQTTLHRASDLYVHNDVALTACPGGEISSFVHNELQALINSTNTQPIAEDEMPAFWVQVDRSIYGCFNGILRPLYGAEWEFYKSVGIKQVSISNNEFNTLKNEWGRVA